MRPHRDTPFTSSGSHFGWCACQICERRSRWPRRTRTTGYTRVLVWQQVKDWHERVYREMWEDFYRDHTRECVAIERVPVSGPSRNRGDDR